VLIKCVAKASWETAHDIEGKPMTRDVVSTTDLRTNNRSVLSVTGIVRVVNCVNLVVDTAHIVSRNGRLRQ
jgi:hypothetical protein